MNDSTEINSNNVLKNGFIPIINHPTRAAFAYRPTAGLLQRYFMGLASNSFEIILLLRPKTEEKEIKVREKINRYINIHTYIHTCIPTTHVRIINIKA